jgi:hypothetical protein
LDRQYPISIGGYEIKTLKIHPENGGISKVDLIEWQDS